MRIAGASKCPGDHDEEKVRTYVGVNMAGEYFDIIPLTVMGDAVALGIVRW
jgi:hypothetical protein